MHPTSLTPQPTPLMPDSESIKPLKVIAFTIAGYTLALPIDAVLKVVNCPPLLNRNLGGVELVHLGQYTITVLNLLPYLATNQLSNLAVADWFLIVTNFGHGEVCALLVDQPPDLIELPPSTVRVIPASSRQTRLLHTIATHVAVLPQAETSLSVFLIDLEQVFKLVACRSEDNSLTL